MNFTPITLFTCFLIICSAQLNDTPIGRNIYRPPSSQPISCFPADTLVFSKLRGIISMDDLKIGQEILTTLVECTECEHFYTKVVGWLHRDPEYSTLYIQLFDNDDGSFFVSPKHNLARVDGSYGFARDLLGTKLFGNEQTVKKILGREKKGVYAPMTDAGNYFIINSNGKKVLAHCFAEVVNPTAYDSIVLVLMKTYDSMMGVSTESVHPVATWLMKHMSILMQE